MSAESREAIAAAMSAVDGVNCTPYFRQSLKPGDACVRFGTSVRAQNGFGFVNTWEVWLALHQDIATGEKWLDDHLPSLLAALDPELVVTSVTPAELLLGGTSTNGVIIAGAREG